MRYATRFNGIPLSVALAADPPLDDRPIDATTRLSGSAELTVEASPKSSTYADDRYEYSCIETPLGPKSLLLKWQLRRIDGSPFKVAAFKVEAAVPGLDLHRVFVPVLHEAIGKCDLISLPWGVAERTFTSWSFPFIAGLNRFDRNRFCMGFMDHVHAAEIRHSCYDEDANMSLQRLFDPAPRETSVWEETLYLSCEDRPIFDEVRAFSRAYDEMQSPCRQHLLRCGSRSGALGTASRTMSMPIISALWCPCSKNGALEGIEGEFLQARVYDRGLEKTAAFTLSVENHAVILDLAVEIGGVLELQVGSTCLSS